tara:strand:- start:285 stop:560 length:276 start_codon:yes stop_codon:yes gene_type:complete
MPGRHFAVYKDGEIIERGFKNTNWFKLKSERTHVLNESDWRVNSDVIPNEEWVLYRQFLRDLPQNYFDESDEVTQGANAADDAWVAYPIPE